MHPSKKLSYGNILHTLGGYFNLAPIRIPDMVCKVYVAVLHFHISSPFRKWDFFFKIHEKIVKIDKNKKYVKSIAEIGSSLPQYIWIVCTTSELVCGGGGAKVSKHPVNISWTQI